MRIVSTYAGHESSITVYEDGKITIVELDKFTGEKYFSLGKVSTVEQVEPQRKAMIDRTFITIIMVMIHKTVTVNLQTKNHNL